MSRKIISQHNFTSAFSAERLWSYYQKILNHTKQNKWHVNISKQEILMNLSEQDFCVILNLYADNIKISQEAYLFLHLFEILLRNKIDIILKQEISKNWLQDNIVCLNFLQYDNKEIQEGIRKLSKNKKLIKHETILAELSFGFWCNLLGKKNDNFWKKNNRLKSIFPHLSGSDLRLNNIHTDINIIRIFRNRIAHYEPVHKRMWVHRLRIGEQILQIIKIEHNKITYKDIQSGHTKEQYIYHNHLKKYHLGKIEKTPIYDLYYADDVITLIRKYLCDDIQKFYDEYLGIQKYD